MSRVTRSKSVRTSARTGSARAQLQPVVVKVVEGPGVGLQHRHEGGLLVIGGRKEADFVLPDSTVSGQHLSLELLPGKARLRDLGSRNGTRYLGARITDALVPLGARVQLGKTTLELQAAEGATVAASEHSRLGELLGPSRAMRRVFAFLERTAQVDGSVLLEGETGTGKALAARTLHALSPRAGRPASPLLAAPSGTTSRSRSSSGT